MSAFAELQARLGHQFRDENLLRLALTHPSVAHEAGVATAHNQRLEFLGDSVLSLVLSRELYEKFPAADEGALSKARAKLVNGSSLAQRASASEITKHLVLATYAERVGARNQPNLLADTFEAVLGAIFLDGGFDAANNFILREFAADFTELVLPAGIDNPKGELQELLQAKSPDAPVYELISADGPDHDRNFICAVLHGGAELARGSGKSKKAAESAAALAALEVLRAEKPAA